jgi:hypothetical protein
MVSTANDFVPTNCNQSDCLGISGFKANRCSSRNVKTITICFDAIELELGIRLDEMVMRANLPRSASPSMIVNILTWMGLSPLLVTFNLILFLPSFNTIFPLTVTTAPGCFVGSYSPFCGNGNISLSGMGKKLPYKAFARSPSSLLIG